MESSKTEEEPKVGILKKIWRYRKLLIIEPLVLCWLLPSCLLLITIQNLSLEKACRVNLGYDAHICTSMLDKELYDINCDAFKLKEDTSEISNSSLVVETNQTSLNLNFTVCKAETETQKKVTYINGIRGPMSSIFPIIVILFAGGWSDRKGLRKPCMLFPMIGELISMIGLLISSIFMDVIPMEYGAIIERVIPSMLGGQTLMIMGIYSYLTEVTEEKDRAFRFGIFGICVNIIQLAGVPFSGTLHNLLGYVKMYIIGACILILGIMYLIFFIPEIKSKSKVDQNKGKDNPAFESTERAVSRFEMDSKESTAVENHKQKHQKNFLMDFFDPTSAYDCLKVFFKKRENDGRFYLILLVLSYWLFVAPAIGEADYAYTFPLINLSWNGEMFSWYSTYSSALTTFGTFLMTGVLMKILKLSDSMAGFISSLGTVISRPMLAFSKDSILYYAATTVDLFIGCKAIAIKSIISIFVESAELGRLYSVLGITEALAGFIFPPLYSYIYSSTIETFPGAFYLFSEIFLIPTLLLFGLTYVLLRKQNKENAQENNEHGVDNHACEDMIESTNV